jgi:hypothetical protein
MDAIAATAARRVSVAPRYRFWPRTGLAAGSGDIGMTVLDAAERRHPRNARLS